MGHVWRMVDRSLKHWWGKWDASTRNEATRLSWKNSLSVPVDRIRITGARFLVRSGSQRHPRTPQQTQSSRATLMKWGQDILLEKNGKQKDLNSSSSWMQWQWQWSLKLWQKWQPQTSATSNVISWNLGPLGMNAAQLYMAQGLSGHAEESSYCNAAGDPDSPRKQVQGSARIQVEVSRILMLHCCWQWYWLSIRYGRWPSAKWWIQRRKRPYHSSHLSAQMCVSLQSTCCELA